MSTKFLGFVVVMFLIGGVVAGCSEFMGVEGRPGEESKIAIGPIRPIPIDTLIFQFDETAPAASTLSQHPSVATWRLKLDGRIPNQAVLNGNMDAWRLKAWVWGWDAQGNEVANGAVFLGDPDDMDSWYCTVAVAGQSLDMEQAGALFEDIVDDIEIGGDGNASKLPCWVKALRAGGALAGAIAAGGAALAACVGSAGTGCLPALLALGAAESGLLYTVLDWICDCVDPNFPLCDE